MCRGSGAVAARKKLTTINLPGSSSGACRRRPPGDPSHSSARPHFEKRFSQRPRAWPAPGLYGARSERTEPPPASDGSARNLSGSVENAQILAHVILRHVNRRESRTQEACRAACCRMAHRGPKSRSRPAQPSGQRPPAARQGPSGVRRAMGMASTSMRV